MRSAADLDPPAAGRLGTAALIGLAGVATAAANVLQGRYALLAALPIALGTGLYLVTRVPLRWSAGALVAVLLTVDVSTDAAGIWHTPFVGLGDLLRDNLDRIVPGLAVNGFEVAILLLLAVWGYRRATASAVDDDGRVATAGAARDLALLFLVGLAYAEANGLARGTGPAAWKLRNNLHVLLFFLLGHVAFRGPRDHGLLARIVLFAASVKALMAVWVQQVVAPAATGGELSYATSHGDSALFTVALVILLARPMERPDRRRLLDAAVLGPLLLLGVVENGRRLAWVVLATSFLAIYLLSPWRPWKRLITRGVVILLPIAALYVGVGWNRDSSFFGPIRLLRSVSGSSADASTRWRDIENWNIAMSIREHPVLGAGLGAQYTIYKHNADISMFYPDYRGWPHNSVLGLLLLAGLVAFAAMWCFNAGIVYLAVRSYRLARDPDDRVAALACIAAVIACMGLAYGDTGANLVQYRILLGLAMAVAAKLAVATGAWPAKAGAGRTAR